MLLHCNNNNCKHNDNQTCTADKVFYVDRLCVTFRKRPRKENYRELMKTQVQICRREGGKLKSNSGTVLKVI